MAKRTNSSGIGGFTLIETLVAITILIIGIMGPLTLATKSISSFSNSKNQLTALYLTQEALEYVRNVRDDNDSSNWIEDGGLDKCIYHNINNPKGCRIHIDQIYGASYDYILKCNPLSGCIKIKYDSDGGYNYEYGQDTIFTRTVKIIKIETEPGINDEAQVEVTVEWLENGATKNVTLKEDLFNWK